MRSEINELLASPDSPELGRQLLEWAQGLRGRILRGDLMIGILSVDDALRAPEALRRASECGQPAAWVELGLWYADPPFGEADPAQADEILSRALAANIPDALKTLVRVRWLFRKEELAPEKKREAFSLLSNAVAENPHDADALHLLGLLTCEGFGTKASPKKAYELQRRAAALGNSDAQFEIYAHLENGLGVRRDAVAAFEANRVAAEAGHPRAMYNMGAFFATGRNVGKDMTKAAEWYSRASEAGNVRATSTLAVMYARGDGVPRDRERAEELFQLAESLGYDMSPLRELVDV